jgi:hypothetical protein
MLWCQPRTFGKQICLATHPCIFKIVYSREVKDTSQDGEGESEPTPPYSKKLLNTSCNSHYEGFLLDKE